MSHVNLAALSPSRGSPCNGVQQALLRRFEESDRNLSGFNPVSFVRDENLLKGDGADIFSVYPEYSFNVRPLAPEDQAMINGVIINFDARFFVRLTAAEVHARGVPLTGLYLQMAKEEEDPRILPMFSRRLAGRVKPRRIRRPTPVRRQLSGKPA